MRRGIAIAIAAHPDDIEFYMAGTLLLLRQAGYETHYFNLASGNCGSAGFNSSQTSAKRRKEAQAAAGVLGARFHRSLTNDLEIVYTVPLLRRVAAVIREVRPNIVLTHSPQDYMEDHTTTCRLAVTASFARGMPNFKTSPQRATGEQDVTLYHCMPHCLQEPLRRRVAPGIFIDTTTVHSKKMEALAKHRSQQDWLRASQGLNSYLRAMDSMSRELGRMSKGFEHSEGWRRHLHVGFSGQEIDPLREALGRRYRLNSSYERSLNV